MIPEPGPVDSSRPEDAQSAGRPLGAGLARALVAITSAAVLVLEILAGRLLAPYVGVSLETFTGIIGVVLAGIALGAWGGGVIADQYEPHRLIGPSMVIGGALAWMALPIVRGFGPAFGTGPIAIILLSLVGFFAPATVLSAVTPMVAKLRLNSLAETGAVVGGLSAAGTLGALAGTFLTGFVLVSALPTRPIVMLVGAILVVGGAAVHWFLSRAMPTASMAVVAVLCGLLGGFSTAPCQIETGYSCANIVIDEDNPSGRSLYLDYARNAYIDLDDPTNLDIRYIRLFAHVIDGLTTGPIETLHLGGGGFSLPIYLQDQRPGTFDLVLEIDPELEKIATDELGLRTSESLVIVNGDARLGFGDLADDRFEVIVGDAFAGFTVPWHLTTREFVADIDRVLTPDGIYVANLIDGGDNGFARAELATLMDTFEYVRLIVPIDGIPQNRAVNQVAIASHQPIPNFAFDPADGRIISDAEFLAYVGDAQVLRDDFAPVDQLVFN